MNFCYYMEMPFMKFPRLVAVLLSVLLLLSAVSVPAYADTLNAQQEIDSICEHYQKNLKEITTAQQVILFGSVGAIRGKKIPDVRIDSASDEINDAATILARLALETDPAAAWDDGTDPLTDLSSRQREDGSFGDLLTTVYAASALQAAQIFVGEEKTVYSAQGVTDFLLARQEENGSFGTLYETARTLSYLSCFSQDKNVKAAITKAVEYLRDQQTETGGFEEKDIRTLCAVICALKDTEQDLMTSTWHYMPQLLADYRNEDGTYRNLPEDEKVFNDEATMAALEALDAQLSAKSALKKLTTHGVYRINIWNGIKNFVYVYGALALLALIFWGYILFGKKKTVDAPAEETGETYESENHPDL